ncbi:metabotropic glutamate receptor 7-like [Littorina saxatilis]|uniref:metabotropic glutamate receptor 7-like n=1 Tax=Littorina saxatilis TaxID=31220 RepID=UPI0038B5E8F7
MTRGTTSKLRMKACVNELSPPKERWRDGHSSHSQTSGSGPITLEIPQISYASTSIDLSDKGRFEYFSRVVPPDSYQAQAMVDIAKELQWKYVNTIAEAGTYGEKGIEAFKDAAKKSGEGVCIAESKIIPRNAEDADYESIIKALLDRGNPAKVGVMFANEDNSKHFVAALARLNRTHDLKLLASDSWGAKIHPVEDQEEAAVGTITILVKRKDVKGEIGEWGEEVPFLGNISPLNYPTKTSHSLISSSSCFSEFDDYFLNLTLDNNRRNPWFPEFWAEIFNCTKNGTGGKSKCSGRESLRNFNGYRQEGLVQFVMDAVYSLAHAVHKALADHCPPDGFPDCPHRKNMTGERLLQYIRNVSFTGIAGDQVQFNANGDGMGRYDIYQFQKTPEGGYQYARVGEWTDSLVLDVSSLQWKNGSTGKPPESICSQPCQPGESRKRTSQCCWICAPCKDNEFLQDEEHCQKCDKLSKPSDNRTGCVLLPEVYIDFTSFWFLIPAAFCVLGIISTGFVLAVFIRYNDTPVIMASGRELCYLLLLGIFLAYVTALLMLLRPCPAVCAIIRLGVGVSLCFIYAGLLTKTNRIYRIFNVGIKAMVKRPSYTSPRSQILICSCLVSVQIVGGLTWLGFEKPAVEYRLHARDTMVKMCSASQVATMISLFYNMFLIVLCTVYAFKTRNIPQNFNEAKYIAFAMYSTCIVWCAFVPIYFGANHDFKIEVTSLCMTVGISATVSLFCLFAPKVYIVVFNPHKNVRQTTATHSYNVSSALGPKPSRSLFCPTSSSAFPLHNGTASCQEAGGGGGAGAVARGEGTKSSRVEVMNAFHDSLENLSCEELHQTDPLQHGLSSSMHFTKRSPDFLRVDTTAMGTRPAASVSELHIRFMDQSPVYCGPAPPLNNRQFPPDHTVAFVAGEEATSAPLPSTTNTTVLTQEAETPEDSPGMIGITEVLSSMLIGAPQQPDNMVEIYSEVDVDPHAPLVLEGEFPDPRAEAASAIDSLLGPSLSRVDVDRERPSSVQDRNLNAGDSLLRLEPASRISDSNLNRRNGRGGLNRVRQTSFGSCDNNKTSLLGDL